MFYERIAVTNSLNFKDHGLNSLNFKDHALFSALMHYIALIHHFESKTVVATAVTNLHEYALLNLT